MKNEDPKYKEWKNKAIEDINEIVITDHIAFTEFLEQVLDLAFMHGKEIGMKESFEAMKKKLGKT